MLPFEPESLKRYTREKIEHVTGGKYREWTIGISNEMKAYEDTKTHRYSWPCLSHELASKLMNEYVEKGMQAGSIEKNGISLLLHKN